MSKDDNRFVNELDGVGAARRRIAERMGQKTDMSQTGLNGFDINCDFNPGNVYNAKDIQNMM